MTLFLKSTMLTTQRDFINSETTRLPPDKSSNLGYSLADEHYKLALLG